MANITDPLSYLIHQRQTVLDAYSTHKTARKTYDALGGILPDLHQAMKYRTFEGYIKPLTQISDAFTADLESAREENNRLRQAREQTLEEMDRHIRRADQAQAETERLRARMQKTAKGRGTDGKEIVGIVPGHVDVDGQQWTIQLKPVGKYKYYYAYKRIDRKLHYVSVGKKYDEGKAIDKIRAYKAGKLGKKSDKKPEDRTAPDVPRYEFLKSLIFKHGNKGRFARIERVRADYERHHDDFDPLLAMQAARYEIELHVGGVGGNLSPEEINGAYYDADGERYLTVSWVAGD